MTCFVHVNQKKTLKHQSPSKVGKPDYSQGSLMGVFFANSERSENWDDTRCTKLLLAVSPICMRDPDSKCMSSVQGLTLINGCNWISGGINLSSRSRIWFAGRVSQYCQLTKVPLSALALSKEFSEVALLSPVNWWAWWAN